MALSLPHRSKWLRTATLFTLLYAVSSISYLPAASASPGAPAPGAPDTGAPLSLYLPLVLKQSTPVPAASSFDLIQTAFEQGRIDAETALQYKVFAVFDDARLPQEYRSGDAGGEAGLFMNEVVAAFPTLSASAQAVVAPFFIPPYLQGSWAEQEKGSLASTVPGDWAYISAANGLARVWYKTGNAALQRQANVVAGALSKDIWDKEVKLMGKHPVYDGAGVQNFVIFHRHRQGGWKGSSVPLSTTYGLTVPKTCAPSATIIYLNPALPDIGNSYQGGLKDVTAHEFMHALQFAFPRAVDPCREYNWMGEATATWAVDFVYPDVNIEWAYAPAYLDSTYMRSMNTTNYREYGEYLLPYWFTHTYTNTAVRQAWEYAGSLDSLKSFSVFGNLAPMQLAALWNRAPFDTFFWNSERFGGAAKPDASGWLNPTGGFFEFSFSDNLRPGGARFFRLYINESVHTISFLNGLSTKITAPGGSGDTAYAQENVSPADSRGADVVTMLKFEGLDAPYIQPNPARWDLCQDWLPQKVSEIVVIIANNDTDDRERFLKSTGLQSKIMVSTVPCMQVTGTASLTRKGPGDVLETLTASGLDFTFAGYDQLTPDARYRNILLPNITLRLKTGSVSWQISGTDQQGCTHSGSNNFTLSEINPSALQLMYQLLPGSQHYNGYVGNGLLDYGSYVTKTVKCPDRDPQEETYMAYPFFTADGTIPVKPDGTLSGSKTVDNGDGTTSTYEWNLQPATLP